MKINLNDPNDFTLENLAILIGTGDDSENSQLRIDNDGFLFISRKVGADDLENVMMRYPTFLANGGYVGPTAAADESHVNRLYDSIKSNFENPTQTYIDIF